MKNRKEIKKKTKRLKYLIEHHVYKGKNIHLRHGSHERSIAEPTTAEDIASNQFHGLLAHLGLKVKKNIHILEHTNTKG